MKRMVSIGCAAVLAMAVLALPARASDSLLAELTNLAKQLKAVMDEKKVKTITLRDFSGPTRLGSPGAGLQDLLIQALKAQNVKVEEDAPLYVEGKYALADDPKDGDQSMINLEVTVRNDLGGKVIDLQAAFRNNEDIVRVAGATVPLDGNSEADKPARNKIIADAIKTPKVFIEGSKVKASKGSPYSVEVLVGEDARQAKDIKGQAFVTLKKGEIYAVKVTNRSKHEAAVSLTIDGLSVFAFSKFRIKETDRPRYTHFIVPKGESMVIEGWHRDNKELLSFKVVDFKDSAFKKAGGNASMLRNDPRIGTLTVCFHMAWSGKEPPAGAREGGPPTTGFGPPVKVKLEEVQRTIGVLRDAISIRYSKPKAKGKR